MRTWFKGLFTSNPRSSPAASTPAALRAKVLDEDIPRYPPFMKGLPVLPPQKLVDAQFELLDQIQSSVIVKKELYEKHYLGAIRRFAAFAHLLPASQSHHHRGAGGLLRHSMECGLMALQGSDKMLLDLGRPPSHRRELEPRLQLAAFLGGLCHDAGKPATDVVVTSHDRELIWRPIKENLWDWAQSSGIDSYFLEWRPGRNKQHQALSNLLSERIITNETLAWIAEGGTELVVWLMESLNENPTATNPLFELIKRADQQSVKRDLETMGTAMAGYEVGVPVERSITDKMRTLVRQGIWGVNEPGARVWNIGGHIYLVWPAAGQELAQSIRDEGIPGIPRTCDSILDMLVERQLAFLPEGHDTQDRLWRIAPDAITAKIPGKELTCIRLRNDSLVSTIPIARVPGIVVGLAGSEAESGATSATSTGASVTTPKPAQIDEQPSQQSAAEAPAKSKPERSKPQPSAQMEEGTSAATTGGPSYAHDPDTGEITDPGVFGQEPREEASSPPPALAPTQEAQPKEKPKRTDPPTVKFDGAAGEGLKALIDDLKSGTRKWDVDVRVDAEEHVLITWPSAFAGYGLTGKVLLEEMSVNEWLWIDEDNPLRKLQDLEVAKGETIKVLRLAYEASYAFLYEAKPNQAKVASRALQDESTRPPQRGSNAQENRAGSPAQEPVTTPAVAARPKDTPPPAASNAKSADAVQKRDGDVTVTAEAERKGDLNGGAKGGARQDRAKKEKPNRSMPSRVPVAPPGEDAPPPSAPATEQSEPEKQLAQQLSKRLEEGTPPVRKKPAKKEGVTIDEVLAALEGAGVESTLKPGWKEFLLQDGRARLKEGGVDVERSALFNLCKENADRLEMAKGLILYKPKG
ncbi:MobH family relaxase [Acidovorax delafieldii]|uniref:MobH family relaxase n=1 Tax=Acidovorax delafieldii TaxID=47920 RepID=UPI003ECC8AE1